MVSTSFHVAHSSMSILNPIFASGNEKLIDFPHHSSILGKPNTTWIKGAPKDIKEQKDEQTRHINGHKKPFMNLIASAKVLS